MPPSSRCYMRMNPLLFSPQFKPTYFCFELSFFSALTNQAATKRKRKRHVNCIPFSQWSVSEFSHWVWQEKLTSFYQLVNWMRMRMRLRLRMIWYVNSIQIKIILFQSKHVHSTSPLCFIPKINVWGRCHRQMNAFWWI